MKIRNTIKSLALVGATAALLPVGSAMAAGPGFNSMTVDGTGNISGCPTEAAGQCNTLLTEAGFLQQEVTVGTGGSAVTYIQTVVIDVPTASAGALTDQAFADNTFIRMGGGSGIKGQQILNDQSDDYSSSGNDFDSTTTLLIGWAEETGVANLAVTQELWDNNATGRVNSSGVNPTDASQEEDDFYNQFTLGVNLDTNGNATGKSMDMVQDVGLSDPTVSSPGNDFQKFVVMQRSGDLQTTAGTHTLDSGSGVGTGGTVSWASGEDVMVAWLGQRVALGGIGSSNFGFMSVDNVDTTTAPISTFSTSSFDATATPFNWTTTSDIDTLFGAAPVLP